MGGRFSKSSSSAVTKSDQGSLNGVANDWPMSCTCTICNEADCDAVVSCCSKPFHGSCLMNELSKSSSRGRRCPNCLSIIALVTSIGRDADGEVKSVTEPLIQLLHKFSVAREVDFERNKVMDEIADEDQSDPKISGLESKSFESTKSPGGEQEKCIICMDKITARTVTIPCGHPFDFDCIGQWIVQSNKCPVCNAEVKSVKQCSDGDKDREQNDGQSILSLREMYSKRDPSEDLFLPIFQGKISTLDGEIPKTFPDWRMH